MENTDYFTDPRDGKAYKTVKIGNQIWMAVNLNYNASGSKCYDNDPKNAEKYGRLYDWNTAMKVCPQGWHLPTNEEWDKLYRFADGTSGTGCPYKSETAGKHLKAKSGWNYSLLSGKSGNGLDTYGFAALPGYYGYWWSASEYNASDAYRWSMYDDEYAYYSCSYKSDLFSVRCVKN